MSLAIGTRGCMASVTAFLAVAATALGTAGPAGAATTQPKTATTFKITLRIDAKMAAATMTGSGVATSEVIASPLASGGAEPTAWEGTGPIEVADQKYAGLPFCTVTATPASGTLHVSIVKQGDGYEVTWAPDINMPPPAITCAGQSLPALGKAAIEPFLLVEPRTFTVPAAGGTQQLSGGITGITNTGTMTVTPRLECQPKVTSVETYPPGQPTQLSSLAGKGFEPGQKITADTNIQINLADGSIFRLSKGSSFKQSKDCADDVDPSPDFKGTLLLGKIWSHVTRVFGDDQRQYIWSGPRTVNGVRGTTFTIDTTATRTRIAVIEGSVWVRRRVNGRMVGPKVIVKAGHTAVQRGNRPIVLTRSTPADVRPY